MFLLNRNLLTNPVILRLCCGSGPDKTFTTWRYSFDLLLVPIEKVYKAPAKLVIETLIAYFWCLSEAVSFHCNKTSATQKLWVIKPCLCPRIEILSSGSHKSDTIHYKLSAGKSKKFVHNISIHLNYKNEAFLSLGIFWSSIAFCHLHFLLSPTY